MNKNNQKTEFLYDDEYEIMDLLMTLWLKKKIIISLTATITILAGIYTTNLKPYSEAKALVEIGKYNFTSNIHVNSNQTKDIWQLIDSVPDLVKKLNVLFIDVNNDSNNIFDISSVDKTVGLINIISTAESSELAVNGVNRVTSYIQSKHAETIDEIISRKKSEIKTINSIINRIQNQEVAGGQNTNQVLINIISTTNNISNLIEKKQLAESLLLPHNYKNSRIIGEVMTRTHFPHKWLIIIVAFFGGFIFSIFLVLIMSVFRSKHEKEIA